MDHQPRRHRRHPERPRPRRPDGRDILKTPASRQEGSACQSLANFPPEGAAPSAPWIFAILAALLLATAPTLRAADIPEKNSSDAREFIGWLLHGDRELSGIPFSEVLAATSGKKIIPVDKTTDAPWLEKLGTILDATLASMNEPSHPVHSAGRINEASRFIEDELLARCAKEPGWSCGIPRTAAGEEQRSGYPDLRLALPDGSIAYLDPKLHAADNRASTLRTFYYEPKTTTGKVHDDARHLLIGISHNGGAGGRLRFTGWELVDVSRIKVRLKAEFQASNADMYRPETSILSSTTTAE